MNADKLASFRVDSELWQKFQGYAKENNTNASALLVAYIKSVVNTGNVITSNENVNTSSEGKKFSLSIQDIDKCIDEKLNQYIQNIDAINTLSIQDIDERISESITDGDIGEAIAKLSEGIDKNYESMMGQFNGLLEEVQDLKSQVQELKLVPPAAVPKSPIIEEFNEELTTDNDQLLMTNDQLSAEQLILNLVPFSRLIEACDISPLNGKVCGEVYHKEALKQNGIFASLKTHQSEIEEILNITLSLDNDKYPVREMNKILKALGYEWDHKQISKVEKYWVINPKK